MRPFPPLIDGSDRSRELRLSSTFPPLGGGGSGDGPSPSGALPDIPELFGSTGSADRTSGPPAKKCPPPVGAEPTWIGGAGSWYSSSWRGGEFRGGESGGDVLGEMELFARGDRPMGPDFGMMGSGEIRGGP
jgi:hypothetical protein